MVTSKEFIIVMLGILFLFSIIISNVSIVSAYDMHIKNNTGWNLIKQEKGTIIYIDNKQSKTPLICEIYPDVKDKKDLPSRNIYTSKDIKEAKDLSDSKTSSIASAKNKKEKEKTIQMQIDKQWADCYQVESGDVAVQKGDSSTIVVYQDYSSVEYIDGDNNETITSFILQKFNGTDYNIEPQNIWIKGESDCSAMGKDGGLCFGATDKSMNETQLANFSYTINSNSKLYLKVNNSKGYSYPIFYTNFSLSHWGEQKQLYSFKDVCEYSYAKCNWSIENNTATITFISNKNIDPTVFPGGNGTAGNPYQITNCTYLQAMNESVTSHYIIMNNINCSGITFSPVLTASVFSGSLNGQGYNITNLFITGTGFRVGMISDLNGNISNVNLVNASVTGNDNVGSLIGYHRGGIIKNCNIYGGSVTGLSTSGNLGGFVGRLLGATSLIINSTVNNVQVRNDIASTINIGGFVGLIGGSANISSCGVNSVNITANGTGSSSVAGFAGRAEAPISKSYATEINVVGGTGGYVAGFVGYSATSPAVITESWSTGTVVSGGAYTGGFAGRLAAPITNCYSIVNVTSSADYVGGFIGFASTSTINNSYSAGLVIRTVGGSYLGGFTGRLTGGTINSSYYDNQTSNQTDTGKGLGLPTAQMKQQASFINWDFATPIWYITENITYPSLTPNVLYIITTNLTYPTEVSGTYISRDNILINVSSTSGISITNTTIYLFNSSGTLIMTNSSASNPYFINYTGLANGIYYFNATSTNGVNTGTTETRNVTIDTINPNGTLLTPANNSYNNIDQNFTANLTDNIGLKNATLYIYNSTGSEVNSTVFTSISGTLQSVVGVVVTLIDGVYHWFYKIFDLTGNTFTTQNNTVTIDKTPPSIFVIEPTGKTYNFNEYISFGINVNDTYSNISFVGASVLKPDAGIENVIMTLNPTYLPFFPVFGSYSSYIFVENMTVQPNQTCVAIINTSGATTSLSGDGSPETDTFCSLISTAPVFGDFEATIDYNLTNLTEDSAINFQITSGQPTSANAVIYVYIRRTNFVGEGNQYQVFGEDKLISGFLNKTDTTDTYGTMKIKRVNNTFTFYVINNTDSSWILLGNQTYDMNPGVYMLMESENIINGWGTANVNWTNLIINWTNITKSTYIGAFTNTTQIGTYTVTFFANDTLNNVNNYTQASFKINETNYGPTTPFVLYPINTGRYNKNLTISWSPVTDANNDTVVFNISLLNQDHSFNRTIIDNYGNLSTTSYVWNTSTVPDGNYSITIEVKETLTYEKYNKSDTMTGHFTLDNTPPTCTLINRTPENINDSSTGLFNVLINCTDANGINVTQISGHYNAFATRTIDAFILSPGIPNYWSVRYPNNSLAVIGVLTPPYQIWRAEGRNRGFWFENLTGMNDCTGHYPCYEILNDTFSYAIEDGHYGYLKLTNTSSTDALFNYTYIVQLTAFRQNIYLSWESMISESKKNYSVYQNHSILTKRFDAETYRGILNYTLHSFRNIGTTGTPTEDLNSYYCNSSYDPSGIIKVVDSPNCIFSGSGNITTINTISFTEGNSSYSEVSKHIVNGMFGTVKPTTEFYIYYESNESGIGNSYEVKYADGPTVTNIGFNETNVTWITTDGTTWIQANFTTDTFTTSTRDTDDEFAFGIYVVDNFGNAYKNFTFFIDEVTPVNHPITIPSIIEYNSTTDLNDLNLNGTHRGIMNVYVGVSKDSDAPGTVTHNLSLFNLDGTFNYTINGSFHSPTDSDMWINFDTRLVPNGIYKMNIQATADDKPSDTKNITTTHNFTINNPNATLLTPTNNSFQNTDQNFTVNLTDTLGLKNATLHIFNATGSEVNTTIFTSIIGNTQATIGVVVALVDGVYKWFYQIFGLVNDNTYITQNNTVTIDKTPSTINITYPENIAYNVNVSDLNYTIIETYPDSCWYSINNGITNSTPQLPGTNWTGVMSIQGSNTWIVYCNDSAGNVNFSSVTFIVDMIYPQFTNSTTYPPDLVEYAPGVTYQFNITIENTNGTAGIDFNGINYSLSNITNSFYKDITDLSAGTYNYYYWAHGSGLSGLFNISETYYYTIDKNSTYNLSISGTTPITYGTVTDVVGLNCPSQLTCVLDKPNGIYAVGIETFDYSTGGNINYTSDGISIDINITKASSSASLLFGGLSSPQEYGTTITPTCIMTAGETPAVLEMDGAIITSGVPLINLNVSTHFFNCTVPETQNYTHSQYTYNFVITKATSVLTFLANGGTNNLTLEYPQQINISAMASGVGILGLDKDGIDYLINNSLNVTLDLGSYIFRANITGNENYTDVGYSYYNITVVDTTPPNATLLIPSNNSFHNTDQNFSANLTDNYGLSNATLHIFNETDSEVNTTIFTSISGSLQSVVGVVVVLTDGVYHWFYSVFDLVGNQFITGNYTVTIDKSPPNLTVDYPIDGGYYQVPVTELNVSAKVEYITNCSVNSTFWIYNSNTLTQFNFINSTEAVDGFFIYNITCSDATGNNASILLNYTQDTRPPVILMVNGSYSTSQNPPEIFFNASDNLDLALSCQLYLNGTPYGSGIVPSGVISSITANRTVPDGMNYTINITCYDDVNNIGFNDSTWIFINGVYPQFSTNNNYPLNNSQYTNINQFNITINYTNGTAGIEINGMNYSLLNISDSFYGYVTGLGVGTYNYYYWAYGSGLSGLFNISETYSYTIIQNTTLVLNLTATTPINYSTPTNFIGSDCPSQLNCTLNMTNGIFGVGNVSANYSTPGNANYSATSTTFIVTINKAPAPLTLTSSGGWLLASPPFASVTGGGCPSQLTCSLYLTGVGVTNPYTNLFPPGAYPFVYETLGNANYSYTSISNTLVSKYKVEIIITCRYARFEYYNLKLPWLHEGNCV